MSKLSSMPSIPAPRAMISGRTFSLARILSRRAFSTFRILPRSGRIAWNRRSRPCLAEPPAESPSTMNSSLRAGSRSWQSASLPGRDSPSSAPLRMTRSRALRAASRARAAVRHFSMIRRPSPGFSSRYCVEAVRDRGLDLALDLGVAELGLRLALELRLGELDADDGGQALADVVAGEVRRPLPLRMPALRAQSLSERVSAARKPVTWVPPSTVLMLFANARTFSVYVSLYWSATSTVVSPSRRST